LKICQLIATLLMIVVIVWSCYGMFVDTWPSFSQNRPVGNRSS